MYTPEILFEDNHLIAINKKPGEISQGDKTNDPSLVDFMKNYLKQTYKKPGNVYIGLLHRIDRPVSGVLLFAKTSKAAERVTLMIKNREIKKTYWAVVKSPFEKTSGELKNYLQKNEKLNKSYVVNEHTKQAKLAILHFQKLREIEKYTLLEIQLETGRHHQIRVQLSALGWPIKGDLKYGSPRSNSNGSIHLHARKILFIHPIKKEEIEIIAPTPNETIWNAFQS